MRRTTTLYRLFVLACLYWCVAVSPLVASAFVSLPEEPLYPTPLADRNYPRFSLSFPVYANQYIDTYEDRSFGALREILEFGGVQSLFRYSANRNPHVQAELSVGAGVVTLFDDFEDNLENFGWEGSGFVTLNFAWKEDRVLRFGFHHLSSHVGDEYLAGYGVLDLPVTDAEDIAKGDVYGFGYVRDSLVLSLSFGLNDHLRLYLEGRYAMRMLRYMYCYNDFPWQANFGIEWLSGISGHGAEPWYAAVHVSTYQESSWFPNLTVQVGRLISSRAGEPRIRFGLEYGYGRAHIAAFSHVDQEHPVAWKDVGVEQYAAIGLWYDM